MWTHHPLHLIWIHCTVFTVSAPFICGVIFDFGFKSRILFEFRSIRTSPDWRPPPLPLFQGEYPINDMPLWRDGYLFCLYGQNISLPFNGLKYFPNGVSNHLLQSPDKWNSTQNSLLIPISQKCADDNTFQCQWRGKMITLLWTKERCPWIWVRDQKKICFLVTMG